MGHVSFIPSICIVFKSVAESVSIFGMLFFAIVAIVALTVCGLCFVTSVLMLFPPVHLVLIVVLSRSLKCDWFFVCDVFGRCFLIAYCCEFV